MIKLDKNGLTAPSITTGSITTGDTTISNFNQFIVKNKNGEIEETLCLGGNIRPALDGKKTFIDLGYDYNSRTGALIALRSIDYDNEPGSFSLVARDEENSADLRGYPNGELNWNSSKVVTDSDFSNFKPCVAVDATQNKFWIGYKEDDNGSRLFLFNDNNENFPGYFRLTTGPNSEDTRFSIVGKPDGTLTWGDSKVITNSGLTDLENNLYFADNSSSRSIGYKGYEGAKIALYSANNSNDADKGRFAIAAQKDADNAKYLVGKPDGTLTWSGSNIVTYSVLNRLDTSIVWTTDNSRTAGSLGFNSSNGARLVFYNKNHTTWTGYFQLVADDGSTSVSLVGKPDGTLTWNNQSIITNYNKTHIYFDHTAATSRDIGFSTGNNNTKRGAYMTLKSGSDTSAAGYFIITARDESNATSLQGRPGGALTWGGSTIYTAGNLTGGVSTIATSNLTASRALIANSSGKVAVSSVTSTELGYLDGVTSNIQTQLNSKIDLKPGAIIAMAADATPGTNWLVCQGQEVSRTTYAALWNAIGTKYGAGDGSTTFNVPSLINRVIMGTWSTTFGTTVESGLPNISGTIQTRSSNGSSYGVLVDGSGAFSKGGIQEGSGTGGVLTVSSTSKNADIISFNASKSSSIYGKSSIVQPPALLIRYYIKY